VRALVLGVLARMREGSLTVVESGRRTELGRGAPHATIDVHSPRFWRALLRGSRGLAESYADGLWDSPDLTALIRLAARNAAQLDAPRRRFSPLREPYGERFRRLWRLYLSYCEAGFAERRIGVAQALLAKPRWGAQRQRVSSQTSRPPYSAAASSTSAGAGTQAS
jgi:hypothetical protein